MLPTQHHEQLNQYQVIGYRQQVIPDSLGGQDTRLSPVSPGFNSRSGNSFALSFSVIDFSEKKKLLPGFEPGSLDSKSRVLTITPQERGRGSQPKSSSYGDRTHDPWLIRPMLYHLS